MNLRAHCIIMLTTILCTRGLVSVGPHHYLASSLYSCCPFLGCSSSGDQRFEQRVGTRRWDDVLCRRYILYSNDVHVNSCAGVTSFTTKRLHVLQVYHQQSLLPPPHKFEIFLQPCSHTFTRIRCLSFIKRHSYFQFRQQQSIIKHQRSVDL
jgi:hypothetical protein